MRPILQKACPLVRVRGCNNCACDLQLNPYICHIKVWPFLHIRFRFPGNVFVFYPFSKKLKLASHIRFCTRKINTKTRARVPYFSKPCPTVPLRNLSILTIIMSFKIYIKKVFVVFNIFQLFSQIFREVLKSGPFVRRFIPTVEHNLINISFWISRFVQTAITLQKLANL